MFLRILLVAGALTLVAQEGCTGLDRATLILTILGSLFQTLVPFLISTITGASTTTG
jgi:hypothetical protein